MKPFSHSMPQHRGAFLALFGAFVLTSAAFAGDGGPRAEDGNSAKNLARMNCGAKIECITPDGRVAEVSGVRDQQQAAAALIMDDDTLSCPLQEGRTIFIIKLADTAVLDRFTFVNENASAAGHLQIAVSNYQLPASSDKWVNVDGTVTFSHKRLFNLSLLGVEARYVKLAFNVEKGGHIAALGLYGGQSLEAYSQRNAHLLRDGIGGEPGARQILRVLSKTERTDVEDTVNFDFANLYAHGRVVYVSSGIMKAARRMIDDDPATAYAFAADDAHPTTIIELERSQQLHRVSALYKMEPGRLDVYLLNELNAENPGDLRGAKLVASVVDHKRNGKAAVDFDPEGARYVALRWTPDGEVTRDAFEIAEVNAFGNVPVGMLNFGVFPGMLASTSPALEPPAASASVPFIPEVSP